MTRKSPRAKRPPKCKTCHDTGKVLETRTFKALGITDRKVIPCPECVGKVLEWDRVAPKDVTTSPCSPCDETTSGG